MISLPSITQIKHQLLRTVKRFPLPTLCAAILTITSIFLVHNDVIGIEENLLGNLLLTAMLGLGVLTCLTLATENRKYTERGLVLLGGTILLGLYWWSLPEDINQTGELWIKRHIFLLLGSLVALAWIPYWQANKDNGTLWRWISDLIGALVVTGFFALVLFLGIAAAIWSIEALFGANINEEIYFDVWIILSGLFSPLFFLSQFPEKPLELKAPQSINAFMNVFTKYIMTPLAGGYLIILYAYTAKILLTGEWPKNVLGWLVIAFLGVAIFTYFLWTPLLKETWEKYRRIFWLVLIPQIFLLFITIGWRIHAYSWTENRYFVVVLGLWLLGTSIYFLMRKNAQFKWVFIALTAIIFVSQIGPLSGYRVAEKAQTNRLMQYLTDFNIKQNNTYQAVKIDANDEQENEVASILDYLSNTFGDQKLRELFPESTEIATDKKEGSVSVRELMQVWGLEYRSKWERNRDPNSDLYNHRIFRADMQQPLDIANYDWKLSAQEAYSSALKNQLQGYSFKKSDNQEAPAIKVYLNDALVETINLAEKFNTLLNTSQPNNPDRLTPEQTAVFYESDQMSAKIYLTNGWQSGGENFSFGTEIYVRLKN